MRKWKQSAKENWTCCGRAPLKKMLFLLPGIVSCNVDGSNCHANWQNGVAAEFASAFGRLDFHDTVDGCEILHHQKDGWKPINHGINQRFQLVQDFATIQWYRTSQMVFFTQPWRHPKYNLHSRDVLCKPFLIKRKLLMTLGHLADLPMIFYVFNSILPIKTAWFNPPLWRGRAVVVMVLFLGWVKHGGTAPPSLGQSIPRSTKNPHPQARGGNRFVTAGVLMVISCIIMLYPRIPKKKYMDWFSNSWSAGSQPPSFICFIISSASSSPRSWHLRRDWVDS